MTFSAPFSSMSAMTELSAAILPWISLMSPRIMIGSLEALAGMTQDPVRREHGGWAATVASASGPGLRRLRAMARGLRYRLLTGALHVHLAAHPSRLLRRLGPER